MQRRLQDVHVEDAVAQGDRAGVRRDEFTDERFPRAENLVFVHAFI